jgi:hypothetical protein
MDSSIRNKLLQLIDHVENSERVRSDFLSNPLNVINSTLGLNLNTSGADLSLGNQILLHIIKDKATQTALQQEISGYKAGQYDRSELKTRLSDTLTKLLPVDLSTRVTAGFGGGGGPIALANLIVHVDTVVLITEAAVIHSEYAFSGDVAASQYDIKALANAIAGGT